MTPTMLKEFEAQSEKRNAAEAEIKKLNTQIQRTDSAIEDRVWGGRWMDVPPRVIGRILQGAREFVTLDYIPEEPRETVAALLKQRDGLAAQIAPVELTLSTAEAALEKIHRDVSDELFHAYNARHDAMLAFLVKTLKPFCEEDGQLTAMLQFCPRYQSLLLLGKYARVGKNAAIQISSMLSALKKLDDRKAEDLAAIGATK